MRDAVRVGLLAMAGAISAASATQSSSTTPATGATTPTAQGQWFCLGEKSASLEASVCKPDSASCEAERAAASGDGIEVTECSAVANVACFQRGGDPSPAAQWCAGTIEHCEAWRKFDADAYGGGSAPCAWQK